MATAGDVPEILNELIAAFLPVFNQEIGKYMTDAELDPWASVASETASLGKIDLGICTASAEASYAIKNMKGLSSLEITSMKVDSISGQTTVTGTMSVAARLDKDLSATLSGSVSAKCGILHEKVTISGTVKASKVTAAATAAYSATLGTEKSCLESLELTSLKLSAGKIDVTIKGLGIFGALLEPFVDIIVNELKSLLTKGIAFAVMPVLNKEIDGLLPYCVSLAAVEAQVGT